MKYARVFLKGSDNPLRWVDVPLQGSDFANFVVMTRMQGAIQPQAGWPIWVPFDEIKFMAEIEVSEQTPGTRLFGFPTEGSKPN
jgi:hypothetical protein